MPKAKKKKSNKKRNKKPVESTLLTTTNQEINQETQIDRNIKTLVSEKDQQSDPNTKELLEKIPNERPQLAGKNPYLYQSATIPTPGLRKSKNNSSNPPEIFSNQM